MTYSNRHKKKYKKLGCTKHKLKTSKTGGGQRRLFNLPHSWRNPRQVWNYMRDSRRIKYDSYITNYCAKNFISYNKCDSYRMLVDYYLELIVREFINVVNNNINDNGDNSHLHVSEEFQKWKRIKDDTIKESGNEILLNCKKDIEKSNTIPRNNTIYNRFRNLTRSKANVCLNEKNYVLIQDYNDFKLRVLNMYTDAAYKAGTEIYTDPAYKTGTEIYTDLKLNKWQHIFDKETVMNTISRKILWYSVRDTVLTDPYETEKLDHATFMRENKSWSTINVDELAQDILAKINDFTTSGNGKRAIKQFFKEQKEKINPFIPPLSVILYKGVFGIEKLEHHGLYIYDNIVLDVTDSNIWCRLSDIPKPKKKVQTCIRLISLRDFIIEGYPHEISELRPYKQEELKDNDESIIRTLEKIHETITKNSKFNYHPFKNNCQTLSSSLRFSGKAENRFAHTREMFRPKYNRLPIKVCEIGDHPRDNDDDRQTDSGAVMKLTTTQENLHKHCIQLRNIDGDSCSEAIRPSVITTRKFYRPKLCKTDDGRNERKSVSLKLSTFNTKGNCTIGVDKRCTLKPPDRYISLLENLKLTEHYRKLALVMDAFIPPIGGKSKLKKHKSRKKHK